MTYKPMRAPQPNKAGIHEVDGGKVATSDILAVRRGPGANCSSIGSALDLLFLSAVAAGVVFAGVAAAFGDRDPPRRNAPADDDSEESDASTR